MTDLGYRISDLPTNAGVPQRDYTPIPYLEIKRPKKMGAADKAAVFMVTREILAKGLNKKGTYKKVCQLQKEGMLPTTALHRKWLVEFSCKVASRADQETGE
jgi:hypothetical protein